MSINKATVIYLLMGLVAIAVAKMLFFCVESASLWKWSRADTIATMLIFMAMSFFIWLVRGPIAHIDIRPIIHVWTHNGVTRVIPHVDWEIWHRQEERRRIIYYNAKKSRRPDPEILILFSDNDDHTFVTGHMEDYEELVKGCRIETSESEIPSGRSRNYLSIIQATAAVHESPRI